MQTQILMHDEGVVYIRYLTLKGNKKQKAHKGQFYWGTVEL